MDFSNFCIHNDIDYSISYNDLGYYPRGFVFKKPNGKYHVTLNGKHNIRQLERTLIHEIVHIFNNHLEKDVSFKDLVEHEAEFISMRLNKLLSSDFV